MPQVYLFDWGDTLMVDFPESEGKMCDWEVVQAVDGAGKTLQHLSQGSRVYIATNAADSSEADIERAFERADLAQYISGYLCKANLGISKTSPGFYEAVVARLGVDPAAVTMVGDSFEKDIAPAIRAGLSAIWFNPRAENRQGAESVSQITHLLQLCT